jgi:hypothetical protein
VKETQTVEKTQQASSTVPDLRKVQEDLHSAVALLDSAVTTMESLPPNHSRAIWKHVVLAVREDIGRYASKLLELLSGTPKTDKT